MLLEQLDILPAAVWLLQIADKLSSRVATTLCVEFQLKHIVAEQEVSHSGCCVQGGEAYSEALLVGAEGRVAFPEVERLALDRALTCHLLQVVYDASPLVRAEVALALSRMVTGHAVLFQVTPRIDAASLDLYLTTRWHPNTACITRTLLCGKDLLFGCLDRISGGGSGAQ